jgi:hypothetical protein
MCGLALAAAILVGRSVSADAPITPLPVSESPGRASSETQRSVREGGVTWTISRSDSPDGPCVGVVAVVDGQQAGSVGGGCGTSDDPRLRWGIGGLEIDGAWFNVAYGEVAATASSVSVTLGSGTVVSDDGMRESSGAWLVVVPAADPLSRAAEIKRIAVVDETGAIITDASPPSMVDVYLRDVRQLERSAPS